MSNFWKSAVPAFERGYQTSSENYIKNQRINDITQQKADEQNQQNFYLQQLLSGQVSTPDVTQTGWGAEKTQAPITLGNVGSQYSPVAPEISQTTTTRPLSLPEKITALVGMGNTNFDNYQKMQSIINPPQKQPTYDYNQNSPTILMKDAVTGQLTPTDQKNPLYKQVAPKASYITTIPDYKTNEMVDYHGYENPNADPKAPNTKIVNGVKYTITDRQLSGKIKEADTNGNDVLGKPFMLNLKTLFKNYQTALADYQGTQQGIKNATYIKEFNAAQKNNPDYTPQQLDEAATKAVENNALLAYNRYKDVIDRAMTDSAQKWVKDNITQEDTPQTEWGKVQDAFQRGKLSHLDFQLLQQKFQAENGYDPSIKFSGSNANTVSKADKYTVGQVYQDAQGNKATYLGNGQWRNQ